MSSVYYLIVIDRVFLFLGGVDYGHLLKQTREEELALLTEMETEAFNVQAKYFENGILPPFSEEETEQNSLTTLIKEKI